MEEITFMDVLTHYQIKLREASDDVENIRKQLKKAQNCVEMGWSGPSAEACLLKLEYINSEMNKTLAEMSEALTRLSAVEELLLDEANNLI